MVATGLTGEASKDGWRMVVCYGMPTDCAGCGLAFMNGTRAVLNAAGPRLLCGRCAEQAGLLAEEVTDRWPA